MAGRRLLGDDGKFVNNNKVAAVVAKNNDNLKKLISSEVTRVGFSGKTASSITTTNTTKDAEKDRIKALDAAHYSLSGKAAREQQGLSWYQPLDMSTVGGNTRNTGGIDADGDYLNQDVMSFTTKDNFIPDKSYTTNLRSKKNIQLFGNSLEALNEINEGAGSKSLAAAKSVERITTAIVASAGGDLVDPINLKLDTIKENSAFQEVLDNVPDVRTLYQKTSDFVSDSASALYDSSITKKGLEFVGGKLVELNDTTVLNYVTDSAIDHINTSIMLAKQPTAKFFDGIKGIGTDVAEMSMQYVDAIQSIGTYVDAEVLNTNLFSDDYISPKEFADMRSQAKDQKLVQKLLDEATEKRINLERERYNNTRIIGAEIVEEKKTTEAKKEAVEIVKSINKGQTLEQAKQQFNTEQEIKAFEAELAAELANEQSKEILKSNSKQIATTKKVTSDDVAKNAAIARKKKMEEVARNKAYKDAISTSKFDNTTADDIAGPATKKYPFQTMGKGDGSLHGTDPFRFTTLEYPTNVTQDMQYGHYMLFYVNVQNKTKYDYHGYNDEGKYVQIGDVIQTPSYTYADGPRRSETTTSGVAPTDRPYTTKIITTKGSTADEVSYARGGIAAGKPGAELHSNQVTLMRQRKATQGMASRLDLTSRITDSVALYLPSDIENTTATEYQAVSTGIAGYLALGGGDILKQIQNEDYEGAADQFLTMGGRFLTEGMKRAGIAAIDAFNKDGGGSVEGAINKIFGQTTNPFIEVSFQNIGVRSFEYTFNFKPKSEDETKEVKAIIQLFRFHMVPELKGSNHRYMTLPSTFDIHYMYQSNTVAAKENTFLNKIATCVLKNCSVNYTPTGVKSFDDGAPTQITMSLNFMETEILTKEKVNDGF